VDREKPFYLRQPWEVLFKETKLEKVSPWTIDLVYLLTTLLDEMNRVGMDFRAAGIAISSSAVIHLKKAELLLEMEEPPKAPPEKGDVYVPPPISLPFRFQFTTTTMNDLIAALERALSEEGAGGQRPKLPVLPPPPPDFMDMDAYLLEIEERAKALLARIRSTCVGGEPLTFTILVSRESWLEVVRLFMMLLFLAQNGEIGLQQDEDETDVTITILGEVK